MSESEFNGLKQASPAAPTPGVGTKAAAKTRAAIDTTADRLRSGVEIIADKAQKTAERTADKVHDVRGKLDPVIAQRPYAAIGAGVALGLVLGLVLAPRPRVIYVKPRY